jgi:hypothetical protein
LVDTVVGAVASALVTGAVAWLFKGAAAALRWLRSRKGAKEARKVNAVVVLVGSFRATVPTDTSSTTGGLPPDFFTWPNSPSARPSFPPGVVKKGRK